MDLLPEDPFVAVDAALDNLERFLDASNFDKLPILLTQPPSRRIERIASIKAMCARFDSYQNKLDALASRHTQLRTRVARRRAMCASSLAPISAMPSELLLDVFARVSTHDMNVGARLIQVCSEWRDIAEGQKDLWSSITVSNVGSAQGINAFLNRSGSLPFRLVVAEDRPLVLTMPQYNSEDLTGRLKHLEWRTSRNIDRWCHLKPSAGYPLLETLEVFGDEYCSACQHYNGYDRLAEDPYPDVDWLGSDLFPALSSLHFNHVYYQLQDNILQRLVHLKIVECVIDADDCLAIFENAQMLESLEIRDSMNPAEIGDPLIDVVEGRMFHIPSLRRVVLYDVPIGLPMCLLNRCKCPSLRALSVGPVLSFHPDHIGFEQTLHRFLTTSPDIEKLEFDLDRFTLQDCVRFLNTTALDLQLLRCSVSERSDPDEHKKLIRPCFEELAGVLRHRSEQGITPLKKLLIPACMADALESVLTPVVNAILPQRCSSCPNKYSTLEYFKAYAARVKAGVEEVEEAGALETDSDEDAMAT